MRNTGGALKQTNLRLILIVAILAAFTAFAQSDRGTITGTITDPAGAVVPGAKLSVRNTETGVAAESVTTNTGNFTVASLPAGNYDVSVEVQGFRKVTQQGIQVQVAQIVRLAKSESAEQSINVSGDRINNLPLNFGGGGGATGNIRSWTAFALLEFRLDLWTDRNRRGSQGILNFNATETSYPALQGRPLTGTSGFA